MPFTSVLSCGSASCRASARCVQARWDFARFAKARCSYARSARHPVSVLSLEVDLVQHLSQGDAAMVRGAFILYLPAPLCVHKIPSVHLKVSTPRTQQLGFAQMGIPRAPLQPIIQVRSCLFQSSLRRGRWHVWSLHCRALPSGMKCRTRVLLPAKQPAAVPVSF